LTTVTGRTDRELGHRLADELKTLARCRNRMSALEAHLPLLAELSPGNSDQSDSVPDQLDRIHRLISAAAKTLNQGTGEAAVILFGDGPDRFLHGLKARRENAGNKVGLSESSFRKKRKNGTSPYDQIAVQLAEALLATEHNVAAPDRSTSATTPADPIRRVMIGSMVVISIAAAGFSAWGLGNVSSASPDESGPRELPVASTVSFVPAPTSTISPTPPAAPTLPTSPGLSLGIPFGDCDIPLGASAGPGLPSAAALSASRLSFDKAIKKNPGLGCPRHLMIRWGSLWVQSLAGPNGSEWRLLVDDSSEPMGFVLNQVLFEGYFRILDGDNGTAAQFAAGLPASVDNNPSRPIMRTANGSVIVAENDKTRARWLSPEAAAAWKAMGEFDGDLGFPITDVNFVDGAPRQEFERGWGRLIDGSVEVTLVSTDQVLQDVSALGRSSSMILETFDHTSWWIDAKGLRHWIDSLESWECLGGESAKVQETTPGWVVADFTAAGVAECD